MLVIQQNCGKGYEYIISALKARLSLNIEVLYIQEPFLEMKNLAHAGFNLYWLAGSHDRKNNCVFVAVGKDLHNRTIVKNRIDFISHP